MADGRLALHWCEAGFIQRVGPHVAGRYGLLLHHISGGRGHQACVITSGREPGVVLAACRCAGHEVDLLCVSRHSGPRARVCLRSGRVDLRALDHARAWGRARSLSGSLRVV